MVDIRNKQYIIDNINEITIPNLIELLSAKTELESKEILTEEKVIQKIRENLFIINQTLWTIYFLEYFEYMPYDYYLQFIDLNNLEHFFCNTTIGFLLFKAALKKDINKNISFIFSNENLIEIILPSLTELGFNCSHLNYENTYILLKKLEEKNLEIPYSILKNIPIEHQVKLLAETFNLETIITMTQNFSKEAQQSFFNSNCKYNHLFTRFNIVEYAKEGISFSESILDNPSFFEKIKNESLIVFRTNINNIELKNASWSLLQKIAKYYQSLINSYNSKYNMFNEYILILDNPDLLKKIENNPNYITTSYIINKLKQYCVIDDKNHYKLIEKEKAIEFLVKETNYKLSEIIIDALFKDNIYNVWANIIELLSFNQSLPASTRILNDSTILFYQKILI